MPWSRRQRRYFALQAHGKPRKRTMTRAQARELLSHKGKTK